MSESPTPLARTSYRRATVLGLVLAAAIAAVAVNVLVSGAAKLRPAGTLPTGEAWSPYLGATVASTGTDPASATSGGLLGLSADDSAIYAFEEPGVVIYDSETLARRGAVDLHLRRGFDTYTSALSADGSTVFVIGEDRELFVVTMYPDGSGSVLAARTNALPPNEGWRYFEGDSEVPQGLHGWWPDPHAAPDGSAVYFLDVVAGELWRYPGTKYGGGLPNHVSYVTADGYLTGEAVFAVNPVSGVLYLITETGLLRTYDPLDLSVTREVRLVDESEVNHSDTLWLAFGGFSDDGSIVYVAGRWESEARNATTLAPVLTAKLPYDSFVAAPAPGLLLAWDDREALDLVNGATAEVVATFLPPKWAGGWVVGADLHHLYYVTMADAFYAEENSYGCSVSDGCGGISRLDVSKPAPELFGYRWKAALVAVLALVVAGLATTQRRWRPASQPPAAEPPVDEPPAVHPSGPRGLRPTTVIAICLVWIPFLNLLLATVAQVDSENRGQRNARAAFWVMVPSWAVTLGLLLFVGRIMGRVADSSSGAGGLRPLVFR